jgi:hypothetical protein
MCVRIIRIIYLLLSNKIFDGQENIEPKNLLLSAGGVFLIEKGFALIFLSTILLMPSMAAIASSPILPVTSIYEENHTYTIYVSGDQLLLVTDDNGTVVSVNGEAISPISKVNSYSLSYVSYPLSKICSGKIFIIYDGIGRPVATLSTWVFGMIEKNCTSTIYNILGINKITASPPKASNMVETTLTSTRNRGYSYILPLGIGAIGFAIGLVTVLFVIKRYQD